MHCGITWWTIQIHFVTDRRAVNMQHIVRCVYCSYAGVVGTYVLPRPLNPDIDTPRNVELASRKDMHVACSSIAMMLLKLGAYCGIYSIVLHAILADDGGVSTSLSSTAIGYPLSFLS